MSDLRKLLGKLLEEQDLEKEKHLIELNMASVAKKAAKEVNYSTGSAVVQSQKLDPVAVAKQSLLKAWNDINLALKVQSEKGMFDSAPEIKSILKLIKAFALKDTKAKATQQEPVPAAPAAAPLPAPKNPGVS